MCIRDSYNGEEHNSYRLLKENTEIELAEYQDTLTSYLINASAEGHGTVEGLSLIHILHGKIDQNCC